jgi:hypothetical protein
MTSDIYEVFKRDRNDNTQKKNKIELISNLQDAVTLDEAQVKYHGTNCQNTE